MSERRYILLIDDDEDIRDTLGDVLRLYGHEVTTAANGAEALKVLRNSLSTSLILLDLMMPVMDGWQFRAAQLEDPRLAAIPVVVLSGQGQVAAHARALGAMHALAKPIDLGDLLAIVTRYDSAAERRP